MQARTFLTGADGKGISCGDIAYVPCLSAQSRFLQNSSLSRGELFCFLT